MDSCYDTFGNLIRYFAFRRYLIDLKLFRRLLGFEMVEKQSKSIIETKKCTEIPDTQPNLTIFPRSGSGAPQPTSKRSKIAFEISKISIFQTSDDGPAVFASYIRHLQNRIFENFEVNF